MNKMINIVANQEGSAIIFALLILVVTTILGVSATRMSVVDSQIVRNEAIYKQNMYEAESAAIEIGQQLYNDRNKWDLSRHNYDWLNEVTDVDLIDPNAWDVDPSGGRNAVPFDATFSGNLEVGVVDRGPSGDTDLGIGAGGTREHRYSLFGIKNRNDNGQIMIEIGYKKRF
jgi:hypothetical protein